MTRTPCPAVATRPRTGRHPWARLTAVTGTVAGVVATLLAAPATAQAAPAPVTLTIDAGTTIRPVTHVGAGGLYALADATTPSVEKLLPLHLNQLTQPAPGVQQLGNGATVPTGDALKVAPSAIAAGAQQMLRMPDVYPNFPYRWVGWDDWLAKVRTMVQDRLDASTTTNINGWELWNEPDGTWDTAAAGPFNEGWTRTYRELKTLDTVTPVVGPSISSYNHDYMLSFLTAAKAAGTLPDVISWHLWDADALPGSIADLHAIEDSLGIGRRPISINEYAWPDQVDIPSSSLRYLATFERETDVRDAERAYWFESGTMNGLLHDDEPTSTYWLYQWYGGMTGSMVDVQQNGSQDGVAALDGTRKILDAVVGGASGNNTVAVTNLAGFGDTVKVSLQYTPTSGRFQNTPAPTDLWTRTLPVTSGTVTVPIGGQDAGGAYHLVVTPASGPTTTYQQVYEAESASISNAIRYPSSAASNGSYVGNLDNSGDARNDSFVDFLVQAPVTGDYDLGVRYANGTGATSTQGLAYDGGAWQALSYPPTSGWAHFADLAGPTLHLTAGYHTIRIAKGAPSYAGGTGYAELDSIRLTSHTDVPAPADVATAPVATFVQRVEAETATVNDGQRLSSAKASGGGYVGTLNNADSYVDFPVTVPSAGSYTVTIGYANGGSFTQNGTSDAVVALSANGGSATDVALPTSGPWGGNGGGFIDAHAAVTLPAGASTVRLTKLVGQNYAELDYLQVSSPAGAVVDGRTTQTVTFPAVGAVRVGAPDVALAATASSGLPVTYTASGACTIVGRAVHAVEPGACTVTASQVGDSTYAPAPDAVQSLTVGGPAAVTATLTGTGPNNGWYASQVVVALAGPSGRAAQYRVDGGTWRTYSRSFVISAAGRHTVDTRLVTDGAVVDGSTSSFSVAVDRTAPAVTGQASPRATGSPRNPVSVTFAATDAGSGVAAVQYRVDGGSWRRSAAGTPVRFGRVGDHVVTYRATDVAGNTSAVRSLTVRIVADPATTVTARTRSVAAGGYATYAVAGFHRYTWVTIALDGDDLTTVLTDANGAASVTATIPAGTTAGTHTVTAGDGTLTATTSQQVS